MDKQLELLKKAVQLKEENPEAEIHVCAASEEILDDWAWTAHKISKVELGEWASLDERFFVCSDEFREFLEDDDWEESDIEEALQGVKPAILIYTFAG